MDSNESLCPAWIEIDIDALERNYLNVARSAGSGSKIIASIKANGYGHDAVTVARTVVNKGAFALATGDFEEALAIRDAGVETKILLFGSHLPEGTGELLAHGVIPTIYNTEAAEAVSRAASEPSAIYIKVDCGLGRLGVLLDGAADFIKRVAALPNVVVEGVYTHAPFFDPAGESWAAGALASFDALVDGLATDGITIPVTQSRASAAVLTGLEDKCNAVCVGHILYGLSPVSAEVHDLAGYDPVLRSIRAKLIHVGDHPAGRDIVVGGHYGIRNSMTTGVLGIGMANGLRNPQGGQTAEMLFRGRRVPVMGVSLEHTTVDLSGIDEPRVGEEVMVIGETDGERVTIDDVAGWQQSTPLEVMMTLSGHLPVRAMTRSDDIWAHFQTEDRYAR